MRTEMPNRNNKNAFVTMARETVNILLLSSKYTNVVENFTENRLFIRKHHISSFELIFGEIYRNVKFLWIEILWSRPEFFAFTLFGLGISVLFFRIESTAYLSSPFVNCLRKYWSELHWKRENDVNESEREVKLEFPLNRIKYSIK